MRKSILAAAAVAALLSIGTPAQHAAAITLATPTELGVATGDAGLVQRAFVRCGYRGCVRVWRRPYWGWPVPAFWVRPWIRPWGWHWHRPWGWHHGWYHHWRHW